MEGEIAVDLFLKAVNTTPFSQKLRDKAKWLTANFSCMHEKIHIERGGSRPKKIGAGAGTDSDMNVKTITTLMNKLTSSNKEHIITQVRKSFRPEFATIVSKTIWNFMLLCPDHQDAYADVLLMLIPSISANIQEIWNEYIENKGWLIKELDITEYDDFCEHVKQKKRAIATILAFSALCKKRLLSFQDTIVKLVDILAEECNSLITNFEADSVKKLELSLDELSTAVGINTCLYTRIQSNVCEWMTTATTLPPIIRFKIYDINDRSKTSKNL